MIGLAELQREVKPQGSSLLGSATCSIHDFVKMEPRMVLAVAARGKGASRRAQGWAGENGDRPGWPCIHRKSQRDRPSMSLMEVKRASLEGQFARYLALCMLHGRVYCLSTEKENWKR